MCCSRAESRCVIDDAFMIFVVRQVLKSRIFADVFRTLIKQKSYDKFLGVHNCFE
jgi:hypothetical protein